MRITVVREETLGEEAAAVVRQAVCLAMQRGHAQVTPLHVASAKLAASPASAAGGALRAACVRSQSHPLQHTSLELFLGVALSCLTTRRRASAADIHHHAQHVGPEPSNAFVAMLRRAQAHRRRCDAVEDGGCGKVELEDLVVSVLDDPGVDRVMRAAGFSGSQLRASIVDVAVPPHRASSDVTTLPGPVYTNMAGRQQSLHTAPELHRPPVAADGVSGGGSECQFSKGKSGTELLATTSILPPWLRRYQDTEATGCGTSRLPVDAAPCRQKFTELTAQNLKILCDALELRVPRHCDIVPGISSTVLWCRSGMSRRRARDKPPSSTTMTCILFRGRDSGGKTAVARELAKLVFGLYTDFTMISASGTPIPSGRLASKRRQRSPHDDGNAGYVGSMFFEVILENPHQVILIDGVDRLDDDSEMRIKHAVAEGIVRRCNGDVVGLADAIVVLCSDKLDSRSMVSSPRAKRRLEDGDATGKEVRSRRRLSMDLNAFPHDGEDQDAVFASDAAILNLVDGVFFFN
ncbi:unnamed protein product [Alopecurus aequalis]